MRVGHAVIDAGLVTRPHPNRPSTKIDTTPIKICKDDYFYRLLDRGKVDFSILAALVFRRMTRAIL